MSSVSFDRNLKKMKDYVALSDLQALNLEQILKRFEQRQDPRALALFNCAEYVQKARQTCGMEKRSENETTESKIGDMKLCGEARLLAARCVGQYAAKEQLEQWFMCVEGRSNKKRCAEEEQILLKSSQNALESYIGDIKLPRDMQLTYARCGVLDDGPGVKSWMHIWHCQASSPVCSSQAAALFSCQEDQWSGNNNNYVSKKCMPQLKRVLQCVLEKNAILEAWKLGQKQQWKFQ